MNKTLKNKIRLPCVRLKKSLFFRIVLSFVLVAFLGTTIVPSSFAQVLSAPASSLVSRLGTSASYSSASTLVPLSPAFTPTLVRGIRVYPDNPLKFDFIVDSGDTGLKGDELKKESEKLIRYFLASLTIPEDELWVNLSPYEKDRIVPNELGETEMGRDMLAQDYLLKQITASLTNPDSDLGKEFWQKIYKKAYEQYGTTNIPVDTFNKVWIMPEKAVVYEQADKAFVVESKLKVMLEEDYVAAQQAHSPELIAHSNDQKSANSYELSTKNHELTSRIVREVFIPALEKEVNEGKNFAQLRQIYNAIILGYWFKTKLKSSIINKIYSDQRKIKGIELRETSSVNREASGDSRDTIHISQVQQIYAQYLDTFKKGVMNFIKVEHDPYTNKNIPRKYFAGGCAFGGNISNTVQIVPYSSTVSGTMPAWTSSSTLMDVQFNAEPIKAKSGASAEEKNASSSLTKQKLEEFVAIYPPKAYSLSEIAKAGGINYWTLQDQQPLIQKIFNAENKKGKFDPGIGFSLKIRETKQKRTGNEIKESLMEFVSKADARKYGIPEIAEMTKNVEGTLGAGYVEFIRKLFNEENEKRGFSPANGFLLVFRDVVSYKENISRLQKFISEALAMPYTYEEISQLSGVNAGTLKADYKDFIQELFAEENKKRSLSSENGFELIAPARTISVSIKNTHPRTISVSIKNTHPRTKTRDDLTRRLEDWVLIAPPGDYTRKKIAKETKIGLTALQSQYYRDLLMSLFEERNKKLDPSGPKFWLGDRTKYCNVMIKQAYDSSAREVLIEGIGKHFLVASQLKQSMLIPVKNKDGQYISLGVTISSGFFGDKADDFDFKVIKNAQGDVVQILFYGKKDGQLLKKLPRVLDWNKKRVISLVEWAYDSPEKETLIQGAGQYLAGYRDIFAIFPIPIRDKFGRYQTLGFCPKHGFSPEVYDLDIKIIKKEDGKIEIILIGKDRNGNVLGEHRLDWENKIILTPNKEIDQKIRDAYDSDMKETIVETGRRYIIGHQLSTAVPVPIKNKNGQYRNLEILISHGFGSAIDSLDFKITKANKGMNPDIVLIGKKGGRIIEEHPFDWRAKSVGGVRKYTAPEETIQVLANYVGTSFANLNLFVRENNLPYSVVYKRSSYNEKEGKHYFHRNIFGYGRSNRSLFQAEIEFKDKLLAKIKEALGGSFKGISEERMGKAVEALLLLRRDSINYLVESRSLSAQDAKAIDTLSIDEIQLSPIKGLHVALTYLIKEYEKNIKEEDLPSGVTRDQFIDALIEQQLMPWKKIRSLQKTYQLGTNLGRIFYSLKSGDMDAFFNKAQSAYLKKGSLDARDLRIFKDQPAVAKERLREKREGFIKRITSMTNILTALMKNADEKIDAEKRRGSWQDADALHGLEFSRAMILMKLGTLAPIVEALKESQGTSTGNSLLDRMFGFQEFEGDDPVELERDQFFDPRISYEKRSEWDITGDKAQQTAVELAMNETPVLAIDGPPGTGKTTVIAEIVRQYIKFGKRVLVVSEMNTAVDNLVDEFESDNYIPLLRLGKKDEKFTGSMQKTAVQERFWAENESAIERFQNRPSRGCVIAATNSGVKANERTLDKIGVGDFDVIIMDEASRENLSGTLAPLQLLKTNGKVIFVGDVNQLPPFGLTIEDSNYLKDKGFNAKEIGYFNESILEVLFEGNDLLGDRVMLSTNYRAVPLLAQFVSQLAYNGRLNTRGWEDFDQNALNFYVSDIIEELGEDEQKTEFFEERDGTSYKNETSADQVLKLVHHYINKLGYVPEDIVIVTPYLAQNRYLQALLRENGINAWLQRDSRSEKRGKGIEIATVTAMQGRESKAVIFDFVRSNKAGKVGHIDKCMLNVAFSRPGESLAIVVDSRMLKPVDTDSSGDKETKEIFGKAKDFYDENVRIFFPENGVFRSSQKNNGGVGNSPIISSTESLSSPLTKGGIDFNADGINLQTKGEGMDFTLPENFKNLRPEDIIGFTPVIINITPVTDFMGLLGLSDEEIDGSQKTAQGVGDVKELELAELIS